MPELDHNHRSTGPRTRQGKENSSKNAIKHGSCSKALLLPNEDPQEQADLFQMWLDDYNPSTGPAMMLVREVATAHWLLVRQRRRYQEAEQCIYGEEQNAMDWTPEHHHRLDLFTRYLTSAERRFNKFLSQLEAMRNSRVREGFTMQRLELQQADIALKRERQAQKPPAPEPKAESSSKKPAKEKEPAAPESRAAALFQGQNNKKKQKKIHTLEQWVEIRTEDGNTVTKLFPSNEQLIEDGKKMWPAPDLVYRRFHFVDGVPPEYHWTAPEGDTARLETGGLGIQRMTPDTWLEVIEREKLREDGHLGPTGVGNLPRPKERGGCDCPVCSRNRAILDSASQPHIEPRPLSEPRP
ncbi:MAG: hypothetical protein JOZ62_20425 [Acidobacteriaceae bacterium]|nr:hypothetical protein [Acidobacteriaceae bacterium]